MIKVLEQYDLRPSPEVERAVLLYGGLNRFGDPNYRLRWGFRCLELRGGEHTDYDDHGDVVRREVRYQWWPRYEPKSNRYHLEVWMPPEFYGSPDSWYAETKQYVGGQTVARLGDYPHRGDYEHVATLESPSGQFVEPTPQAVADMTRLHKRTRDRTRSEIKASIDAELDYQKTARQRKYHDILDSEKVAFPWRTWVPVTGQNPRQLYS